MESNGFQQSKGGEREREGKARQSHTNCSEYLQLLCFVSYRCKAQVCSIPGFMFLSFWWQRIICRNQKSPVGWNADMKVGNTYMTGIFKEGPDQLGSQRDGHLQSSPFSSEEAYSTDTSILNLQLPWWGENQFLLGLSTSLSYVLNYSYSKQIQLPLSFCFHQWQGVYPGDSSLI